MKIKAGQQVFVTKWALSSGIVMAMSKEDQDDRSYPYVYFGSYGQCISAVDVHETIEAAQQRAKALAAAKLKSLEKQVAKLRKMETDGAKMKADASKGVR